MLDLLKLALLLGLTAFLLMRKWDLGLILFLNAAVVALLFAYPLPSLVRSVAHGLVAADTLRLALAVFLVLLLAELMRRTETMRRMVQAVQALVPDSRLVLALLPMLIGMMPMLGGAMFSAPMVDEVGRRLHLDASRKTFINYWFRHTMEYIFPLYSSVLVIATLMGITVPDFVAHSWPFTLAAIAGGVLWGLVGIPGASGRDHVPDGGEGWRELLASLWPLLLILLLIVILRVDMLIGLATVALLFALVKRIGPRRWPDVLRRSFPLPTFSVIFGVMVFKYVLEDSGAVRQVPLALGALGLPPILVSLLVPMIVGLLTGASAATLAVTVPLVAPLLGMLEPATAGAWLFAAGFSGVLLSPMHLCLALTREYFGAEWGPLYRAIVPATLLILLTALLTVWVL